MEDGSTGDGDRSSVHFFGEHVSRFVRTILYMLECVHSTNPVLHQVTDDVGLEHIKCHVLRDTRFIHVQARVHHDNASTNSVGGTAKQLALHHRVLRCALAQDSLQQAFDLSLLQLVADRIGEAYECFVCIVHGEVLIPGVIHVLFDR